MTAQEKSEALLRAQAGAAAADAGISGGGFGLLTAPLFHFLIFSSWRAIYRSNGDMAGVVFVVMAYADLVALFYCLRWWAPPGSATREHLKVVVWCLTTLLTIMFTCKVAAEMPFAVQVLVWAMAGGATCDGFRYAVVFLWRPKIMDDAVNDDATFTNGGELRLRTMAAASGSGVVHAPQTDGSRAQDQRDAAWAGARLILDSGAMGHATGNISLLEDYHPYSSPTVARQADGSGLRVLGIGRIRWGSFSIPNVSHVEGVQDVLISMPQLDGDHHLISCFGNGGCVILQADGTSVVGRAELVQRVGYVLSSLYVPQPAHRIQ